MSSPARRRPAHRRQGRFGAAGRPGPGASIAPGLRRWSRICCGCAQRGQQVILVSSGAIALGRRQLELRRDRCDSRRARPPRRSARSAWRTPTRSCWRTGRHGGAGAADAGGQRAAPALSERARDAGGAAGARGAAGHQRERHGGHGRDPLRRQRPAGRAGRADGRRRLPGAAVGRRGLFTADPEQGPGRAVHRTRAADHARKSRRWRAARPPTWARAAWRPRSWPRRSRSPPAATCASPRDTRRIRCGGIEEGARCTWFVPTATPVAARKQWIAGTLRPAGRDHHRCGRAEGAAGRARACCRPASSRRAGASTGATPSASSAPDGTRGGARHQRLFRRRCGPHHGPQVRARSKASWAFAAAMS